jgi:hypothetical protein
MRNRALFVLVAVVLAGCGGDEGAQVGPQVLAMASPAELEAKTPSTIEVGDVTYQAVPEVTTPTMEMAAREMLQGIFQNDWYRFRRENIITAQMVPDKYQVVGELTPVDHLYAARVQYEGKVVPALLSAEASVSDADGVRKGSVWITISTCEDNAKALRVGATSSHFSNYHRGKLEEFNLNEYPPQTKEVFQEACRLAAQL